MIPAKIPTLVRIPKCCLMGSTPFCFLQKASRFMWLACFVSLCDIIQYIYVVIWFVLKLKFAKIILEGFVFIISSSATVSSTSRMLDVVKPRGARGYLEQSNLFQVSHVFRQTPCIRPILAKILTFSSYVYYKMNLHSSNSSHGWTQTLKLSP